MQITKAKDTILNIEKYSNWQRRLNNYSEWSDWKRGCMGSFTSSSATSAPGSTIWLLVSLFYIREIKNVWERIIRIPKWASCSVWSIYNRRHVFLCTYLCISLQAHVVALVLPFLQFLQGYPHLSNEFIPSQSVHVAHTQPSHTHAQKIRTSPYYLNLD